MTRPHPPLGDDHHLRAKYRRPPSSIQDTSRSYRAARAASYTFDPVDAWALRGIPAISPDGVGGVIPGTQPEHALLSAHPEWGTGDDFGCR